MPEIASDRLSTEELEKEVIRLGPWHLDVEISHEISTRAFLKAPPGTYPDSHGKVAFQDVRDLFLNTLVRIYPNGLEGRSVLDCACNCGGYLFWAKEFGAGECLGFDVRPLWIEQARFLARHREAPGEDIRFEVCDLYQFPELGLGSFDVTLFNGIFYHLPEPVTGLKIAADATKELLIVNTAIHTGLVDGVLALHDEPSTEVMSGVYALSWTPSGPNVVSEVLSWAGFSETRCNWWRRRDGQRAHRRERAEVLAAREAGSFTSYDAPSTDQYGRVRELVTKAVPSGAVVLVVSRGDDELLKLGDRRAWHFPQSASGGWAGYYPADDTAAVAHLEELLGEGAQYLLFPSFAFWWLDHYVGFRRHLESRFEKLAEDEEVGLVFGLRERG